VRRDSRTRRPRTKTIADAICSRSVGLLLLGHLGVDPERRAWRHKPLDASKGRL
jgi:hypothetical protein